MLGRSSAWTEYHLSNKKFHLKQTTYKISTNSAASSLKDKITMAFLPTGYPESVSKEYLRYLN